jgi:hypothetical protein
LDSLRCRYALVFFALTSDPTLLVIIQTLDGFGGATMGVLTTLIVADLTNGTAGLT